MIICNYVYSAFMIVKTACEVTMKAAEMVLDGIFTIVKTTIKLIQFTLAKALEAIILAVSYAIQTILDSLSFLNLKDSAICQNLNKCNFFKEQILNPNSLISRAVYAVWDYADGDAEDNAETNTETGEADTTRNNTRATQELIYQIVNDWDTFREQLCGGLTIDIETGALRGLLQGFQTTINGWLDIFQKKVDYIYRLLQGYLETLRNSAFFDLLDQLKAFFNCLIDSTFCADVDTSKSFFNHAMKVCGLVDNGQGEYGLSTAMVKEATAPVEAFVATCNQTKRIITKALKFLANPVSIKGANNAFKLNSTIKGIYKAVKTGKLSNIPIVKYVRHKTHDILNIWRNHHPHENASYDVIFLNTKYSTDKIIFNDEEYDFDGGTLTDEMFEVEDDADLSAVDDVILVNGNVYTVSEAVMAMNFRQMHPERFKQLNGQYDELLNYCDDVNNFMTDLVDLAQTVTRYK